MINTLFHLIKISLYVVKIIKIIKPLKLITNMLFFIQLNENRYLAGLMRGTLTLIL